MRITTRMIAVVFAVVLPCQAAFAQPSVVACLACRAVAEFTGCERPSVDGKPLLAAKVVQIDRSRCSDVLSIEFERPSENGLPRIVRVDLGRCAYWAGKIGDTINIAVRGPRTEDGLNDLACRPW
jgi:hypothetical protein